MTPAGEADPRARLMLALTIRVRLPMPHSGGWNAPRGIGILVIITSVPGGQRPQPGRT